MIWLFSGFRDRTRRWWVVRNWWLRVKPRIGMFRLLGLIVHSWWLRYSFIFSCSASYSSLSNRSKILHPVLHPDFIFFCQLWHCLHCWESHDWDFWQRHGSIRNGIIRLVMSFERLLHYCSKVLDVVQRCERFRVLEVWNRVYRFSNCVVRSVKNSTWFINKGFIELIFSIRL